jgi:hypothetical protein
MLLAYIDVFDNLHTRKHVALGILAIIPFTLYVLSVQLLLLISN